jgi:hypothetical protein
MTQLTPTDQPNSPPPSGHQRRRLGVKRQWLLRGALLIACAGAATIWYLQTPSPLSTDEQKLVGKWTLPMGPQPPPNAIQQFFELRADRRLVASGRLVGTKTATGGSVGRWRLDDDQLVFELPPPASDVSVLERIFGGGPKLEGSVIRHRFLGVEPDRFKVEAAQGGVGTFERVVE